MRARSGNQSGSVEDHGLEGDPTIRRLAAGGVVAPILDVLLTAWLGALDADYSHVRQYISELGETGRPHATLFSAWCVGWGVLFAGFAVALARGLDGRKGSYLGPGALLVAAACGILSGFFPCDPGCVGETVSAQVHILVGEIATAALVTAPFLVSIGMRGNEAWRGYRALTLGAGVLLAAIAAWLAICHYAGLGRADWALGCAQRVFLGILYVWVEVLAIRLWRLGAARRRAPGPAAKG
jgi:hypothetical membrane protein